MVVFCFTRLARLRGSAFEGCLKAFAVAAHNNSELVRPVSSFVGTRDRHVDLGTIDEIWKLSLKVRDTLVARGFVVKFAQSTYSPPQGRSAFFVS